MARPLSKMHLAPVRVAAPAQLPVSLDEAKRHLRVDDADNDATISALIETATAYFDGRSGILGRALISQSWRMDIASPYYNRAYRGDYHLGGGDNFAGGFGLSRAVRLPLSPVRSISSVTYWDGANNSQTFGANAYTLLTDGRGSFLYLGNGFSWPGVYARPDSLSITFVAGYGDNPIDVPAPIRHAILLMVGHLYENRQSVVVDASRVQAIELPQGAQALVAPYRIFS